MIVNPKISIITPSFNQGDFIEETINSVINQAYSNIEYIIIDGGSSDHTLEIIQKYEGKITTWVSEKDSGQSNAINKGFKLATGEIVTWLGSDDLFLNGALEKVCQVFKENPNVNLVHGNTELLLAKERRVKQHISAEGYPYKYLSGMSFSQPSSFFRRSALEMVGYLNETLHYGMDYDLMIRLYDRGEVARINDFLSVYRLHENSKSSMAKVKFAEEWAEIFSKIAYSVNSDSRVIEHLKSLKLYKEPVLPYSFEQQYSEEFIYKSFLYFLLYQIIFYYQAPELEKVKQLTRWLKTNEPEFLKNQRLGSVHFRSTCLNNKTLKYARRIAAFF